MVSTYPATSYSPRVAKERMERFASSFSTSLSESLLPSMRVEEPMLSMVATRRKAESCSGARVPRAFHVPLNSSISALRPRNSGVMFKVSAVIISIYTPTNTQLYPITKLGKFDFRIRIDLPLPLAKRRRSGFWKTKPGVSVKVKLAASVFHTISKD